MALAGVMVKAFFFGEIWVRIELGDSAASAYQVRLFTFCCDDFRPRRLKAPVVLALEPLGMCNNTASKEFDH